MQGSASLSLCARRQPKRWWVVQWKNSESTDILEVVFQVAQENENHLKRLHSNDSIDLLTYMMDEQPYEKVNGQGYDDWYGHCDAVIMHDGIGRIGHRQNDRTR